MTPPFGIPAQPVTGASRETDGGNDNPLGGLRLNEPLAISAPRRYQGQKAVLHPGQSWRAGAGPKGVSGASHWDDKELQKQVRVFR